MLKVERTERSTGHLSQPTLGSVDDTITVESTPSSCSDGSTSTHGHERGGESKNRSAHTHNRYSAHDPQPPVHYSQLLRKSKVQRVIGATTRLQTHRSGTNSDGPLRGTAGISSTNQCSVNRSKSLSAAVKNKHPHRPVTGRTYPQLLLAKLSALMYSTVFPLVSALTLPMTYRYPLKTAQLCPALQQRTNAHSAAEGRQGPLSHPVAPRPREQSTPQNRRTCVCTHKGY